MGRGFLSGIFWGGILGVVLLFVSSQMLERQQLSFPQPTASAVEVPGGSEFDQARPETEAVLPSAESKPEADDIAAVAVPEDVSETPPALETAAITAPMPETSEDAPEDLGNAPAQAVETEIDVSSEDAPLATAEGEPLISPTAPAAAPATDQAEPEALAVAPTDDAVDVSVAEESPTGDQTNVAALPQTDTDIDQPETAAIPDVSSQVDAPSGMNAPEAGDETSGGIAIGVDSGVATAPAGLSQPSTAVEPSLPPVISSEEPSQPTLTIEQDGDSAASMSSGSDGASQPERASIAVAPSADEPLSDSDSATEPAQPVEVASTELPEDSAPETEPITLAPGVTLIEPKQQPAAEAETQNTPEADTAALEATESGSGTEGALPVVRRLGDSSTEETEADSVVETAEAEAGDTADEADLENQPALVAFGNPFENPDALPILSIILIDDNGEGLSESDLSALPDHIAIALDASQANARSVAQAYRAQGREIVMIPSLPEGAAPQDVEQSLLANFGAIPEAVALMDVSGASFQSDRSAVEQVVAIVSDTGHGLITFPRGLNTAHQQAQRAGVPTGLIFRKLDASGESQEQIRRGLDRAAFRARQDMAVILVASTAAPTLAALAEWADGNRAATVAIAPISAALATP